MDYEDGVKVLEDLEQAAAVESISKVSVKDVVAHQIDKKYYDGKKDAAIVSRFIDIVDIQPTVSEKTERPQERPQRGTQRQVRPGGTAVSEIRGAATEAGGIASSEMRRAATEIGRAVKKLGTEEKRITDAGLKRKQNRPQEELILPSLPLQDQILELEKIITGLDSSVFTSTEIEIITAEVKGLGRLHEKPSDNFQKRLLDLRAERLSEVLEKLKRVKKA